MQEPLPLGVIQAAVIEFLRGRSDAVLFGAQAVNAYTNEVRATEDVDILSTRGADLAEDIRTYLATKFHIAARVRNIRDGLGYRVFQLRKPSNRHLVDVRPVSSFPPTQLVDRVLVVAPAELIASKVTAFHHRQGKPKAGTDWRDIAILVLTFPELKEIDGPVSERLHANGADDAILERWREVVNQEINAEAEDDEFR